MRAAVEAKNKSLDRISAHVTDLNLAALDISKLASADAIAGLLASLGYPTDARKSLTAQAIGLAGDSAAAIRAIEMLSEVVTAPDTVSAENMRQTKGLQP